LQLRVLRTGFFEDGDVGVCVFPKAEKVLVSGLRLGLCKKETLTEAYQMAKSNNGAPGSDGVSFEAIEEAGVERFLERI
jgi:hypothetical protein